MAIPHGTLLTKGFENTTDRERGTAGFIRYVNPGVFQKAAADYARYRAEQDEEIAEAARRDSRNRPRIQPKRKDTTTMTTTTETAAAPAARIFDSRRAMAKAHKAERKEKNDRHDKETAEMRDRHALEKAATNAALGPSAPFMKKPVTIDGVTYASRKEAMSAFKAKLKAGSQ